MRWEPGRAVAWKTRESGATWVYELEATATGTQVTGRRVLPKFTVGTSVLGPVIGGADGHDRELADGIAHHPRADQGLGRELCRGLTGTSLLWANTAGLPMELAPALRLGSERD